MATLLWLVELLGIAEQHQALCGLRYRQDVREGHLPRLINEKYVHCLEIILARPQPSCTRNHLSAGAERHKRLRIVGDESDAGRILIGLLAYFLNASNVRNAALLG